MKNLAIIPARGGSKGVSHKNIRELCGRPLIAWTIEVALACFNLERIVVSTDDLNIAKIAQQYGAQVPFIRPARLAKDNTPDLPVYNHVLAWLAENENYIPELVIWLRPTTPLRITQDIEAAVRLLQASDFDCVRSVCETEHHPYWMKRLENGCLKPFVADADEKRYYRRQLLPPVYRLNGAVDIVRVDKKAKKRETLFAGKMGGYVMPLERSLDLDSELDFIIAEALLRKENHD